MRALIHFPYSSVSEYDTPLHFKLSIIIGIQGLELCGRFCIDERPKFQRVHRKGRNSIDWMAIQYYDHEFNTMVLVSVMSEY